MPEQHQARDVAEAYGTLDPDAVVGPGDPWYVDLEAMLPREHYSPAFRLRRALVASLERKEDIHLAVIGQPGVGKSTMVRVAVANLEVSPINVDVRDVLDRDDFAFSDLILAIVDAIARGFGWYYTLQEFMRLVGVSVNEIETGVASDLSDGRFVSLTMYRRQVRHFAERDVAGFIDRINAFLGVAIGGLVPNICVVVEGLAAIHQAEAALIRHAPTIRRLRATAILLLEHANQHATPEIRMSGIFPSVEVPVLPMRLLVDGPDVVRPEAAAAVEAILGRRIVLDAVFEDPRACVTRLAHWSGGHLRSLLEIARRTVELLEPPARVTIADIDAAARGWGARLAQSLRPEDPARLETIHRERRIFATEQDARLVHNQCVLRYGSRSAWWDVHPSLRAAPASLPSPQPIPIPAEPVVLARLELEHVRGLDHLALDFTPPATDRGQWIVILGPNGVGKTTILRSLALALRNLRVPGIWPKGAFAIPWRSSGAREAAIAVTLAGGVEHVTRVRANGVETYGQEPAQEQPRLFPLFAYGCRRGSALAGKQREVDLDSDAGPEIATLFDEGASLVHAETWLIQLDGDAQKPNTKSAVIWPALQRSMCTLLGVRAIEVRDFHVWITEAEGRAPILLEAMSDGYLTTMGWFLDLVARWLRLVEQAGETISAEFMQTMRGLVLLDEVDLHLHPKWQIEVLERTRELLPQMSFVITTHNPLTLVGARPEEIWILDTRDGETRARRGREMPALLTGGQIIAEYFGIEDIIPHSLGQKLERYGFLAGYALRSDAEEAELHAIEAELAKSGVEPRWPVVPREVPTTEDA